MSYDPKYLSVLAYANGFTLWHFTTTDPATIVDASGYFNAAADMVRVGDMILANVDTDGSPAAGVFLVKSNNAGVVDVADLTSFGSIDSD
ncbi:MAG: hypothetical protein IPM60_02010 [Rhodospirillales bacterium]|nr:hypothetical protein [Rhodospirillales bacterium]